MGVLNVTPDSFHAASRAAGVADALAQARRMVQEGVDVLDVGGESTRPGAHAVGVEAELERVLPVVRALGEHYPETPISVDTYKSAVARRAVEAGASIVNDVSGGLLDPEMPRAVSESGATVVIGHLRGTPETMASAADYRDVVAEVIAELRDRVRVFRAAHVPSERIWLDPGFGFAKKARASRELLFGLRHLQTLGYPIVVGLSRKSFLGEALARAGLGGGSTAERLEISLAAAVLAAERGAVLIRTHDVAPTRRALAILEG